MTMIGADDGTKVTAAGIETGIVTMMAEAIIAVAGCTETTIGPGVERASFSEAVIRSFGLSVARRNPRKPA